MTSTASVHVQNRIINVLTKPDLIRLVNSPLNVDFL